MNSIKRYLPAIFFIGASTFAITSFGQTGTPSAPMTTGESKQAEDYKIHDNTDHVNPKAKKSKKKTKDQTGADTSKSTTPTTDSTGVTH